MKYAIIDVENNGLFLYKDASGKPVPADDPRQPRLASFAAILLDDKLETVAEVETLVKPDGWVMTLGASAVNGLTTEQLERDGVLIIDLLAYYHGLIDSGHVIVSFAAQCDCKQMRGEARRAGLDDKFEQTLNICLMRATMGLGIKKESGKGGWPKLEDVCRHFGVPVEPKIHTALNGARCAHGVFLALHKLGKLPAPAVHRSKNHPDKTT